MYSPVDPGAAAVPASPPTDVSTAGAGDPPWMHQVRHALHQWIAQLQATPLPSTVALAQRNYLLQQLFALALSPTLQTAQTVLLNLWQQTAGPEAKNYYRAIWNLFAQYGMSPARWPAFPPPVDGGLRPPR